MSLLSLENEFTSINDIPLRGRDFLSFARVLFHFFNLWLRWSLRSHGFFKFIKGTAEMLNFIWLSKSILSKSWEFN